VTITRREAMVLGIFGGALPGLAIFEINSHTISCFVPCWCLMWNWMLSASHALFGASAAGV
jgi:hypothetical protein